MVLVLLKRASMFGALFFCAAVFADQHADCRARQATTSHQVVKIFDGDSLLLEGGKKVRLIGINTPETAKPDRLAEPYAAAALSLSKQYIAAADYRVGLVAGRDEKDRYGRTLAHVFLPGGENLAALLLKKGMGYQIAIPPNLAYLDCYAAAEASARSQRLGVWRLRPVGIDKTAKLEPGFSRVTGKVTRIGHGRSNIWLNFDGPLAIRIRRADLRYFTRWRVDGLAGKTIEARGWIYRHKGRLRLQIRHPAMIRVMADRSK